MTWHLGAGTRGPRFALALGSSAPDGAGRLANAIVELDAHRDVFIVEASPIERTPPFGGRVFSHFFNRVALGETALDPMSLLRVFFATETRFGRLRTAAAVPKNAARTLDLDLVAYGNIRLVRPELVLPHPGIDARPFVYGPLRALLAQQGVTGSAR